MKHFQYQVEQLIKGVKDRPALWDKTLEIYKDREERKQAWDEIFRSLEEGFDEMTREEKRTLGDMIINKWTNVRDTFIKSLKNQTSKSGTRKYHYHEEMAFLLKVMPQEIIPDYTDTNELDGDDPISNPCNGYIKNLKQEGSLESDDEASTSLQREKKEAIRTKKFERPSRTNYPSRRKRSRMAEAERRQSEECTMDFVEVNEVNDPRVMNEDEAFFASLLPSVVKYSEDERLEFRIEVLAVMKSINNKRRQKWTDETAD